MLRRRCALLRTLKFAGMPNGQASDFFSFSPPVYRTQMGPLSRRVRFARIAYFVDEVRRSRPHACVRGAPCRLLWHAKHPEPAWSTSHELIGLQQERRHSRGALGSTKVRLVGTEESALSTVENAPPRKKPRQAPLKPDETL